MRPDGVNGAEQAKQPTLPERIAQFAENVSKTDYQIPNSLAGVSDGMNVILKDVNEQIKEFFTNEEKGDNGESISANEQTQLKALRAEVDKLQNTFRNIRVATDNTYRSIQNKILKIIDNIRSASEGVMPNLTVAQEPDAKGNQKSITWSPAQMRESEGKMRNYVYADYQNAMKQDDIGVRKGLLEVLLAKYGYDPDLDLSNCTGERLNSEQTEYIRNYIKDVLNVQSREKEARDIEADELRRRKEGEQTQIGSSFLNRGKNAALYIATMTAALHKVNGDFYSAMTGGLKPPKNE